tara:strand:+ start:49 stop:1062 length:1014 start_codon:yes stop_codon:yes gene_type:complete
MAFKSLRNHIGSLITPFIADAIRGKKDAKSAGSFGAKLRKRGPFDIDDAPSSELIENPLSFNPVQYPLDLGNNGLGHYIVFESGFLGYSPQTSSLLGGANRKPGRKVIAKLPNRSITTSAIALYMPNTIKATYKQTYDTEEAGIAGDLEALGASVPSGAASSEQIKAFLGGTAGIALKEGKKLVGELVSLAGAGDPIRFIQKRAGTALNPRNEQFYNSPDFRSFSYSFDFWPRSKDEAKAVEDIILIFKYNSAPGFKDLAGSQFTIPNYFKIKYMHNGEVNTKLNLISACYCTNVDVDYAPDGQPSFFEDGSPVHIKLTVDFVEDRILTKADIEAGA